MNPLTLTLLISTLFLAHAQGPFGGFGGQGEGQGQGPFGGRFGGRMGMGGGPFGQLMQQLAPEQKIKFQQMMMESRDLPKGVAKARMEQMLSTMPADVRAQFLAGRQKMEQFKAENERKAAGLSGNARAVYNQIHAIMQDQSLSWSESHQRVMAIVSQTDPQVFEQFKAAGMHVPGSHKHGMHPGGMGGPFRRFQRF